MLQRMLKSTVNEMSKYLHKVNEKIEKNGKSTIIKKSKKNQNVKSSVSYKNLEIKK